MRPKTKLTRPQTVAFSMCVHVWGHHNNKRIWSDLLILLFCGTVNFFFFFFFYHPPFPVKMVFVFVHQPMSGIWMSVDSFSLFFCFELKNNIKKSQNKNLSFPLASCHQKQSANRKKERKKLLVHCELHRPIVSLVCFSISILLVPFSMQSTYVFFFFVVIVVSANLLHYSSE